jgi:hypothetical protein
MQISSEIEPSFTINCVYTSNTRAVKTQQTICDVVSQCNIQQYGKYNYMFRPCILHIDVYYTVIPPHISFVVF